MIKRTLQPVLEKAAKHYPVVTLTGPRQSGKTTLVRKVFKKHAYVSLENPDERAFALEDPRGFLGQFDEGVILDEVQRAPELFSYIQGIVDEEGRPGHFILTGSQNFLLVERITQSLAGRTTVLHLLPFSRQELLGRKGMPLDKVGHMTPRTRHSHEDLMEVLYHGFYPRIHDTDVPTQDWLRNYYQTYVERDVRNIINVGDVEAFGRFVLLCAGRSGQLLNVSSLGADCGVTHTTAQRWLSILESSFIVYLLRPHFENFSKRMIKSPKLYFMDTGLLCYLLRIRKPDDLKSHALRGAVFETFVVGEVLKGALHHGRESDVYYWRDSAGHELDLILERGAERCAIEIKSGQTIARDFFKGLTFWKSLPGESEAPTALVYGGDKSMVRSGTSIYRWQDWL